MQKTVRLGSMLASMILMVAGPALAAKPAIAEDPAFRLAWATYVAENPEARNHQRPLSEFPPPSSEIRVPEVDQVPMARVAAEIKADSPQAICTLVRERIRYQADKTDEWQTGEQTWERKTGDCEDFAATVRDLCLARGFNAQIVIFHAQDRNSAHAVAFGEWNGITWMSSNGGYEQVHNIATAQERVIREFGWYYDRVAMYRASEIDMNILPAAR